MITGHGIDPINHQVNNYFSMQQDTSFRAMATLMSRTLTILTTTKMGRKVHVERAPVDISQRKSTQRQQDTILNAGEKPLIEAKNSFDVLLYFTISFRVVTPIFKMQQGFFQRS